MRNTESNKSHVEAHDYLDADVTWLERMHHRRRRILERRGFEVTSPEKLPQTPAHTVVPARRRPACEPSPATPPVAEVRQWAREQGMDVPPRGRLRSDILDAWHAAHTPAQSAS